MVITRKPTERDLAIYKSRRDLGAFAKLVYKAYEWPVPSHLRLINAALMQVERYIATDGAEGISKLRIEVHPRSGKSQTAARLFPAWLLGRHPSLRVIVASYAVELSRDHTRQIRNWMRGSTFASIFPTVKLAPDSQAKDA